MYPCLSIGVWVSDTTTAGFAPGAAISEVRLSARTVVPRVRWPATGITAHILQPSPRLRVHCASAGRRRRATLAYEQI